MKIDDLYQLFLKHPVICTDTRIIQKDALFFCLKGERFNGNKFALQALEKGASFVVTDEKQSVDDPRIIFVGDVLNTLQKLATFRRSKINIPVIGITGSNGKTTTKELVLEDGDFRGFLVGNGIYRYESSHKTLRYILHGIVVVRVGHPALKTSIH